MSTEPLNILRRPKMFHGDPKHSTKTLKCFVFYFRRHVSSKFKVSL